MLAAKHSHFMTFHFLRVEQHSGGGRLRAVSAHGGRQARGEVVAGETARPEEA